MFEKANEVKSFTEGPCGEHGYFFLITIVPPGLPVDHPARERFDDRSIDLPHELGSAWIIARQNGREGTIVATATFAATREAVRCDSVEVDKKHRRRGIATALYDLAARVFERPVEPSDNLSEDAKAFWSSRQ